jgi:hypothetical protein
MCFADRFSIIFIIFLIFIIFIDFKLFLDGIFHYKPTIFVYPHENPHFLFYSPRLQHPVPRELDRSGFCDGFDATLVHAAEHAHEPRLVLGGSKIRGGSRSALPTDD